MNLEFLCSPMYQIIMDNFAEKPYGLDEAEQLSESFKYRHYEVANKLGAWRWRGMHTHTDLMLSILGNGFVVDFGGAWGPLGLGSKIVDEAPFDLFHHPVYANSLKAISGVDAIFTSHTLEHIQELAEVVQRFHYALVPGGYLVAMLPAWTCVRWRADHERTKGFRGGPHVWTFGVEIEPPADDLPNYWPVAAMFGRFDPIVCEYIGDNSILYVGIKR